MLYQYHLKGYIEIKLEMIQRRIEKQGIRINTNRNEKMV